MVSAPPREDPVPAMAPEPSQPGQRRPPGRRNHRPTPRHDVHTAAAATSTKTATKRSKRRSPPTHARDAQVKDQAKRSSATRKPRCAGSQPSPTAFPGAPTTHWGRHNSPRTVGQSRGATTDMPASSAAVANRSSYVTTPVRSGPRTRAVARWIASRERSIRSGSFMAASTISSSMFT